MTSKVKISLLLIAIFICGVLFGAGGTVIAQKSIIKRTLEDPEKARSLIVRRVSKQLNLNDEQKLKLKVIIDEQAEAFAEIRLDVAVDVERTFTDTYDSILPILDDTQKEKFKIMYLKMLERFRKTYYSGIPVSFIPESGINADV